MDRDTYSRSGRDIHASRCSPFRSRSKQQQGRHVLCVANLCISSVRREVRMARRSLVSPVVLHLPSPGSRRSKGCATALRRTPSTRSDAGPLLLEGRLLHGCRAHYRACMAPTPMAQCTQPAFLSMAFHAGAPGASALPPMAVPAVLLPPRSLAGKRSARRLRSYPPPILPRVARGSSNAAAWALAVRTVDACGLFWRLCSFAATGVIRRAWCR